MPEAICAPSRASLLTGTRPDTNGITHSYVKIRELNPDILTLPQHFKNNGYETVFTGKIFHQGDADDRSWSRAPSKLKIKKAVPYALKENLDLRIANKKRVFAKYGEARTR